MPEIGWAGLGIVPEVGADFGRKLGRDVDPSLSRVARDSGKRFGGILGKAAIATAGGLIGAGYAAFSFGKDSLGEAREAQEIGRTSAAILKATGGAAKISRKEYDKLTESLMRKTAIDDEQIAQGGNLLLTFKNVKREGKGLNDIFGRTLSSALDLAAAGFGSIDSASKMLGKALNDPVKGVSALGRAGVTFSEDQKKAIKAMVESNNLLGAQKLILREVEGQVGGTAAKQKTSAKELEVAWGNVKEEIGFALIPVMEDLADFLLDKGVPAAEEFSGWLTDKGVPAARDFVEEIKPLVKQALPAAADALGMIKDAGKELLPILEDVVGAFNDLPDWAKKGIALGGAGLAIKSKLGGKGGPGGLLGGEKGGSAVNPAYVYVVNGGSKIPGTGGKSGGGILGLGGKAAPIAALALFAANQQKDNYKNTRDGKQGALEGFVRAVVPGLDNAKTAAREAGKALDWLAGSTDEAKRAAREYAKLQDARAERNQHNLDKLAALTANDKPGNPFANLYKAPEVKGSKVKGNPVEANLELLLTGQSKKTKEDVSKLLGDVDKLDRRPYDLVFNALGLRTLKNDAQALAQALREIANTPTRSIGGPSGLNPFDGAGRTRAPRRDLNIERLVVSGTTSQQLSRDLQDIQRRAAIGGY